MFVENAYADNDNTITLQETSELPPPEPLESNWKGMAIQLVLISLVLYFLLIRPQEKRRRQQEALLGGVQKGEEVMTGSGIFGVVTKINDNDNTVEIEIAKDVQVKILKSSIIEIISRKKEDKNKKNKGNLSAKAS